MNNYSLISHEAHIGVPSRTSYFHHLPVSTIFPAPIFIATPMPNSKYELLLTLIFQAISSEKSANQASFILSAGNGAALNASRAIRLLASDFAYTESGRMRCAITKPVMHASISGNITS